MDLLIVVVSYRVAHLTIDCLRTLSREIRSVPRAHVAVCENGTGDDSAARIQAAIDAEGWQTWATVTAIHPNRGFTGGNNVILRAALDAPKPPRYFLLLNADTLVHPRGLAALVEFMDHNPHVGIGGSRLEEPDGRVQRSAFRFISVASQFEAGVRLGLVSRLLAPWIVAPPPPAGPRAVDWVSGASMIIRREVLQQIGLLDEGLYTYFDDIDICLRARRAGWPTWYVPDSRVIHLVGQTTGVNQGGQVLKRRPTYWYQARRRFFLKNYGALHTAALDLAGMCGLALWQLRRAVTRQPDTHPPHALGDSFRHSVFATGFTCRHVPNPALAT
jgi:N-acetylglucosaminyl-diphospho-decaprenol L-rhamnosyltransferase